jgi:hypothetical protein
MTWTNSGSRTAWIDIVNFLGEGGGSPGRARRCPAAVGSLPMVNLL